MLLVTAALVAAVAVWIGLSLPPRPRPLIPRAGDRTIAGILHVHSNRSDGAGSVDEIAAAAARAGLAFVVFADHGDATRPPDPPAYRSGVLCLDGVEVSTTGGHYIAIDMPASPYPLAGEPRDVVADVHRLGGFGIAAHPDSPKAALAWQDWTTPIDAIEVINPDTSWRVHLYERGWRSKLRLLRSIGTYPFRGSETIGALLTASGSVPAWMASAERRPIVGLAGADAHAKLELMSGDQGGAGYALAVPSYEASFRLLSVRLTPRAPLSGDASTDARAIFDAISAGHLYTAVDAWAAPASFELSATNGAVTVGQGDALPAGDPVTLNVTSNRPEGFLTTIWRGATLLAERPEADITLPVGGEPGVYRVEIRDPARAGQPGWITSNPIYVRGTESAPPSDPPFRPGRTAPLFDGRTAAGWTREYDASSVAALDTPRALNGIELRFRYGLSGGQLIGQYAGVAVDTLTGVAGFDRVSFSVRGDRPMRLSVQARIDVPGGTPQRWQRSIVVGEVEREQSVRFEEMTPVGAADSATPPLDRVRNLLFIVDTTNTKPGTSGRVWLNRVRLEGK